jgi:hypothetical protein
MYHITGWGVPFLFTLIPSAAEKMTFESGSTFCFLTTEDGNAWVTTFFYIPVGVTLLFGSLLFVAVLVRIVILAVKSKKFKLMLRYVRILTFLFMFLFIYTFIFSYNLQVAIDRTTIQDGYTEYFDCLHKSVDNCYLGDDVSNYSLVMLRGFGYAVLGLLLVLTFVTTELFWHWWKLLRMVIHGVQPGNKWDWSPFTGGNPGSSKSGSITGTQMNVEMDPTKSAGDDDNEAGSSSSEKSNEGYSLSDGETEKTSD